MAWDARRGCQGLLALALAPALVAAHGGGGGSTADPDDGAPPTAHAYAVAFGIVTVAGATAVLGAAVPFMDGVRCCGGKVPLFRMDDRFLAGSLAFAAGVLFFGSLAFLLPEAEALLHPLGSHALLVLCVCLFSGVAIAAAVAYAMHRFIPHEHDGGARSPSDDAIEAVPLDDMSSSEALRHGDADDLEDVDVAERRENARLRRFGLMVAIALAAHKIPEGMTTFIAAATNPAFGAALAVAVAVHNIPESACVAMPIYLATRSKWRAFLFTASVLGLAEPVGALVGFGLMIAASATLSANGIAMGVIYGGVVGILGFVSVAALMPSAIRRDPSGVVTTSAFFWGALVASIGAIITQYI